MEEGSRAISRFSASPEIKRSLSLLPPYWQWLQKTQIPQYIWEGTGALLAEGQGRDGQALKDRGMVAQRLMHRTPAGLVSALCAPVCRKWRGGRAVGAADPAWRPGRALGRREGARPGLPRHRPSAAPAVACRGQHNPVQLLHLQGCRGALLAPPSLLPRSCLLPPPLPAIPPCPRPPDH